MIIKAAILQLCLRVKILKSAQTTSRKDLTCKSLVKMRFWVNRLYFTLDARHRSENYLLKLNIHLFLPIVHESYADNSAVGKTVSIIARLINHNNTYLHDFLARSSSITHIMSFVTMTHEHMRVSVVHYDTTDIPKFFKFFGAKSSSKGEPSDAGTAKGKENSTKRLSNTKAKRVNAAAGSSTALTNSAISAAAFGSSVTLPVPVLNTGTPLDGSSADIHGAVNRLVGSLNKKVSKNTLRSIYNHVVDLREAERNQAHIVQALAHQMAELSVELEEFRSGRKDRRSTDVINAMIQVKAKGGSLIFDRSFSIRTINLIIEEHPELSSELGVLRDAIQEQENQMSDSLASLEADTHGKVFEAFKKIAKLEKHLEDKNAFIRGCYESMDKFEIEVSTRVL